MRPRGWVETIIIGIAMLAWAPSAHATVVSAAEYLARFQELVLK